MPELLVILALILANGVFAGAEIAVLTVRKTRLAELVDQERAGAASLAALRSDAESFLATIQIGITVVSAAAAAVGGATLARPIAETLGAAEIPEELSRDLALGLVVVSISILSIVVGELVPKSLAMRSAERYALLIAGPLALLARTARPAVRFLTGCSNAILRIFGDSTSFAESRLSRDELRAIVEESATAGEVDPRAGELATRALNLHGLKVGAIMTPRPAVRFLDPGANPAEIRALLAEVPWERFPIRTWGPDDALGYVLAREVMLRLLDGSSSPLEGIIREPVVVPSSADALSALKTLQERRVGVAFVVDERGSFVGLLTLDDLLEEIVGETLHERESPQDSIRRIGDAAWLVDGRAALRDINRALDLELPDSPTFTTVSGLILARLGRFPVQGERLDDPKIGISIEIRDCSLYRIRKVILRKPKAA